MRIDITLCLPRDAETVALVRSVTMAALGRLGVTEACIEDIRLALSEACTNVIQHANTDDDYEVRLEVEDERCSITVVDAGDGLDTTMVPSQMPDASSRRGRGIAIMAALADRIDFDHEPEAGTIVRLVKRLDLDPQGALARLHG